MLFLSALKWCSPDRMDPVAYFFVWHIFFSASVQAVFGWQNEINSFCFLPAGEVVFVISPFLWLPVSQREYTGYCTGLHWHRAKSEGDKFAQSLSVHCTCWQLGKCRCLNYLVVLMSEEISKNFQHMLGVLCTLPFSCITWPSVYLDQTKKHNNAHPHTRHACTFCPQTQVHKQSCRIHQGVVIEEVWVLQLIHQPADQIIFYHGSLLTPPGVR